MAQASGATSMNLVSRSTPPVHSRMERSLLKRTDSRRLPLYNAHPRYCAEHGVPDEEITVMIIRKIALPRRTFLRGMDTVLGLPLLDAMMPALSAMIPPEAATRRIGFIYMPNGVAKNSTI